MKQTYLKIGKIVGSHGINGTLRVECWCDSPEFLCKFKNFYTSENKDSILNVVKATRHKNIALVQIKGVDSIEKAEAMRGTVLYIFRNDANLPKGSYFIEEILSCKVYDSQTNEFYGVISDISQTGANDIWHIKNNGKEYLFPSVPQFVNNVNIDDEIVYINPPKGIFDDDD